MKKQIVVICAMFLILFSVGGVWANEGELTNNPPANFDRYIASSDGKLLMDNVYKPSFFERLLRGQAFTFVDVDVNDLNDYSCSLTNAAGSFHKEANEFINSGAQCGVGDSIVFISDGGDIPDGTVLFDNLWFKSSSSDLVNFQNYYLDNKDFYYSYACYRCEIEDTTSSEKGCLTENENACVTQDNAQCDRWYGYESVCLQHIDDDSDSDSNNNGGNAGEDAIDIEVAETNKRTYEVGDIVQVAGVAEIHEDVTGAVIETSLEYVDYVDYQPLSITVVSDVDTGVCGDDITTGVKFNADEGDDVAFKLKMKAKQPGEYRIKVVAATGCGQGITDTYTVDKFTIVASSEVCNDCDGEGQDGTIDDDTPSEDLDGQPLLDWDLFNDDEDISGGNDVAKITNKPTADIIEEYFDFDNNPETAYSVIAIILIVVALVSYVGFLFFKK